MRAFLVVLVALTLTSTSSAHLVAKLRAKETRVSLHRHAVRDLNHSLYVCTRGWGRPKREHCRSIPWLRRVVRDSAPVPVQTDWVARQISAAETIAHESTRDPWPNCPDPVFDGASSWQQTADCENHGSWYDSPGYYRCGLQFDPMWETRFGRLCP